MEFVLLWDYSHRIEIVSLCDLGCCLDNIDPSKSESLAAKSYQEGGGFAQDEQEALYRFGGRESEDAHWCLKSLGIGMGNENVISTRSFEHWMAFRSIREQEGSRDSWLDVYYNRNCTYKLVAIRNSSVIITTCDSFFFHKKRNSSCCKIYRFFIVPRRKYDD